MTEPTAQDIANAERRAEIAARMAAEYEEAEQLAEQALGPGYQPWMALRLIPSDHRQTGDTRAVATVFKVYRGEQKLTENSMYVRRFDDGTVRAADNYEELFGDLLAEKHPTRTVDVKGEKVPVGKYELCWSALELYTPQSATALAARRQTREQNAIKKLATEHPLFAEDILSGELQPDKRKGMRK